MNSRLFTLVAFVLVGLFATWFYMTHEKVTSTRYVGYQGEARVNRFLAAELLLNEVGIDAESRSTLTPTDWLPDYSDTIVTRLSATVSIPIERAALETWVSYGGHLVLLPPSSDSVVVTEFLEQLGYGLYEVDYEIVSEDNEDVRTITDDNKDGSVDYALDLDYTRLRISVDDDYQQSATLSDDEGIVAARQRWGDGYVTLISNAYYFNNSYLEESDHARLLLDVVDGYIEPGKVWFIYDASFAPLWRVIWDNAPYVVIGSAALLFILIWAVFPGFGPKLLPEPPVRRSIVEHIQASGTFIWKQRGSTKLAKAASASVIHRAESRHPGIGRLPLAEQAKVIAGITDIDAQTIFDALRADYDHQSREFTQQMATLHRIRNEI